jgi:uncharacterized membrane protein
MMQVWLVLLGATFLWRADIAGVNGHKTEGAGMWLVSNILLIISVVLVFVNGGTTG